ncbi:type II CAAX endopeptidase family protein [Enterococcus hirae]|nr:type II CAAX endopeptidase family protein [Enterococcus hirae]
MDTSRLPISPKKTIIALLIPLAELLIGDALIPKLTSQWAKVIYTVLIFLTSLCIAVYLYQDVLRKDWRTYKNHLWWNFAIALVGVAASFALLAGVRFLLDSLHITQASALSANGFLSLETASMGLVASTTALMAPFTEEIVFRHVLFYQWKNRGVLTWLMFLLSAIAFGLVHWNNFNGQLDQMIPYMCVGALYALIYYFSKNIWYNIMTHFFFDFFQVIGAILMFILAFTGA